MNVYAFSAGWLRSLEALVRPGGRWRRTRLPLTCLLIERESGLVLVDTGYGAATRASPWRLPGPVFQLLSPVEIGAGETALDRVRALGKRAEHVTDIVCTHLDHDHAGGLADFPHARVHVLRDEKTRALGLWHPRYNRVAFRHGPRFHAHDLAREPLLGFPLTRDLFGDGSVVLIWTPGHSPGHVAVAVKTTRGHALHLGDSVYLEGEMHSGREALGPGLRTLRWLADSDRTTARVTQRIARELVARPDVTIISSHDERSLDRIPVFPLPLGTLA